MVLQLLPRKIQIQHWEWHMWADSSHLSRGLAPGASGPQEPRPDPCTAAGGHSSRALCPAHCISPAPARADASELGRRQLRLTAAMSQLCQSIWTRHAAVACASPAASWRPCCPHELMHMQRESAQAPSNCQAHLCLQPADETITYVKPGVISWPDLLSSCTCSVGQHLTELQIWGAQRCRASRGGACPGGQLA